MAGARIRGKKKGKFQVAVPPHTYNQKGLKVFERYKSEDNVKGDGDRLRRAKWRYVYI